MLSQITLFRVTRVPKQCTGNFKVSNAWTNLWNIMMEEKTGLKIQVGNAEIEHSGELIPILINQTVLEQIKPLQLVGQAADFKFESNLQPKQAIRQSLPKAIREDNRRFSLQNLWRSSWDRAQAQLGLVCWLSTNKGHVLSLL